MKRNIDLTENFDFAIPRRAATRGSSLSLNRPEIEICSYNRNILGKYIRKNIADINYCINEDIEFNQSGGLIQGNGYRRKYMKLYNEPESYCERCGRSKKYPWEDFSSLLCPQCNNIFDYEMRKIPWRGR